MAEVQPALANSAGELHAATSTATSVALPRGVPEGEERAIASDGEVGVAAFVEGGAGAVDTARVRAAARTVVVTAALPCCSCCCCSGSGAAGARGRGAGPGGAGSCMTMCDPRLCVLHWVEPWLWLGLAGFAIIPCAGGRGSHAVWRLPSKRGETGNQVEAAPKHFCVSRAHRWCAMNEWCGEAGGQACAPWCPGASAA